MSKLRVTAGTRKRQRIKAAQDQTPVLRNFFDRASHNQHISDVGRMLNLKRAVPGVDDLQSALRNRAHDAVDYARKLNVAHFVLPLPLRYTPYGSQPASNAGRGYRHPPRLDTRATMPAQPCMTWRKTSMIARARLEICVAGSRYLASSRHVF